MPWHCQIFYYLRNLVVEIFSSQFIHYFWQYFCFYNVCCSYIFKALMAIITFLMRVEFIIWFAFDMILSQANSVHKFLDEVGDNWEVCPCPLLIIWSLQGWNLVLENLQFFVNPLWLPFFSSLQKNCPRHRWVSLDQQNCHQLISPKEENIVCPKRSHHS